MITEFAKRIGISEQQILGESRKNHLCDARHLYWLLLYENGFGYSQIGRMNDRTHGAVIMGIKRVKSLLEVSDTDVTWIREATADIKRIYKV